MFSLHTCHPRVCGDSDFEVILTVKFCWKFNNVGLDSHIREDDKQEEKIIFVHG